MPPALPFPRLQEILPAMKLVKYYAWERFFEKHVSLPAADLLSWLGWAACHAVLHTMLLSDQPACLPAHSLFPAPHLPPSPPVPAGG